MGDPEIPPAGVRLIREARHESRQEFGDLLGVSPKTIGNWERGDQPPSAANREALVDVIPTDLALESIRDAQNRFDDDEEWTHQDEQRLFGSDYLQKLRDKPRVADDLGDGHGIAVFTDRQRAFVERLDLTGVEGDAQRDGERVTSVYYIDGDERRAIRKFIVKNEAVVRNQLQSAPNRFSHEWPEWRYRMLEEEWRFWIYS